MNWIYNTARQGCDSVHARLAVVHLPAIESAKSREDVLKHLAVAQSLGLRAIDLDGAYGKLPADELTIAPWDNHPNATGHRLIAERLHRELQHLFPDIIPQ
jgi:hypothetical protein